jgi:hypothetical protein
VIAEKLKGHTGTMPLDYPMCSYVTPIEDGFNLNDYNCGITVCPNSADTRILWDDVRIGYSTVKSVCKSFKAGGQDHWDDKFVIQVYRNPDYEPPMSKRSKVTNGTVTDLTVTHGTVAHDTPADEKNDRHHPRDFATKRQEPEVRTDRKTTVRIRR